MMTRHEEMRVGVSSIINEAEGNGIWRHGDGIAKGLRGMR